MRADFRGLFSPGAAKTVGDEQSLNPVNHSCVQLFQYSIFSTCKDDANPPKVSTNLNLYGFLDDK